MVHWVAILLFPVRLVTWPLVVPEVTYVLWGVTHLQTNPSSYWSLIGDTSKMWLFWQVG